MRNDYRNRERRRSKLCLRELDSNTFIYAQGILLETLAFLTSIYMVFDKISERNASRHL